MQEVVRVIRSMKQDYLPAKAKPEVHLLCHTPEASDILSEFVGVVTTLSQCSKSAAVQTQSSLKNTCMCIHHDSCIVKYRAIVLFA